MESQRKQIPERNQSLEKKADLKPETYRRSEERNKISFGKQTTIE